MLKIAQNAAFLRVLYHSGVLIPDYTQKGREGTKECEVSLA